MKISGGKRLAILVVLMLLLSGGLLAEKILFKEPEVSYKPTAVKPVEAQLVKLPPSPDKKTVYLGDSSQIVVLLKDNPSSCLLAKELLRQAFLLSAREELGLTTRDFWLGDTMSESDIEEPFSLDCQPGRTNALEISIGFSTSKKKAAVICFDLDDEQYKSLLAEMEKLSRDKFATILQNCGYIKQSKPKTSDAKVPVEVEKLLNKMNFLAQYSAVRQLHELIRTEGESPALQGGLVRGYANLGMLTRFHWHPAHKIFLARSLLYAQRMAAQGKEPLWAEWHRAYAYAITGLPYLALKDMEDAENKWKSLKTASKNDFSKPKWVEIIDAFCRYDMRTLMDDEEAGEYAELNGLLRYVANEQSDNGSLTVTVIIDLLDKMPECYRLYDGLSRFGGVRAGHTATTMGIQVFGEKAYSQLEKMPGMPENVVKVIKKPSAGGKSILNIFGLGGGNSANEFEVRRKLVSALLDTGKTESKKETESHTENNKNVNTVVDTGDPSWATLGLMVRELSFVQTWRRIHFETNSLAVDPADTLAKLKPLYADHRYGEFLGIYSWNRETQMESLQKIREYPVDIVEMQIADFLGVLSRLDREPILQWSRATTNNLDSTECDLTESFIKMSKNKGFPKSELMPFARVLECVSPHSPYVKSIKISEDWDNVSEKVEQWEKDCFAHPGVLRALAKCYSDRKQYDDAIRCLKTAMKISPDNESCCQLAGIYKTQGDMKKWLETQKERLNCADYGLSHGKACEEIAYYFIKKRQWTKALPYAEQAASTYSGWGLLCEAKCLELMHNWDEAERLHKAVAERYRDSGQTWYFFCRRSGIGDLEAARKLVQNNIAQLEKRDIGLLLTFYMLENQEEKGLVFFEKRFDKMASFTDALFWAFAVEKLGDSTKRDEILNLIVQKYENFPEESEEKRDKKDLYMLTKAIIDDFKQPQSTLDYEDLQKAQTSEKEFRHLVFNFSLARYLYLRDREKDAIEVEKQCVKYCENIHHIYFTLAMAELREKGVTQEEIEALLPKENTEDDGEE